MRFIFTMSVFAAVCWTTTFHALGQEPDPDGEAVPESSYRALPPDQQERIRQGASYYSPTLGARLYTQYMYIETPEGHIPFWGARVVAIDPSSPLHELRLQLGDVISRLDGIRISERMRRELDPRSDEYYWRLPEAERHYGGTVVRYVRTGTNRMLEGTVDLGPLGGGRPDDAGRPLPP